MSLSTLELAQLRADQDDYFPDTCTLQTVTRTVDSVGGWSNSWANTHTGVACRVSPLSASAAGGVEHIIGAQLASVTRWLLSVAHDQALTAEMRVVHGGNTYEVSIVEDAHSNRTARRGYLRRVD